MMKCKSKKNYEKPSVEVTEAFTETLLAASLSSTLQESNPITSGDEVLANELLTF